MEKINFDYLFGIAILSVTYTCAADIYTFFKGDLYYNVVREKINPGDLKDEEPKKKIAIVPSYQLKQAKYGQHTSRHRHMNIENVFFRDKDKITSRAAYTGLNPAIIGL